MMPRILSSCLCSALLALAGGGDLARASSLSWLSPELRALENEAGALEQDLASLPHAPPLHLTDRLGFHSTYWPAADTEQWVEVDLEREETIDAIVLVAVPSNSGGSAPAGYGFPVRFRVEFAGTADADEHFVLADFTAADFPNPGALPVFLPAHGRKARVVRVTATRLSCEGKQHFFALGEMMILQGRRNLASRIREQQMKANRSSGAMPVWGKLNLVDGHIATGPPVGTQPSPTLGYCSESVNRRRTEPAPAPKWVQVDLGAALPVEEVRVFPAHPPQFEHRLGYGYPTKFKMELSNDADFQEATALRGSEAGDALGRNNPGNPGEHVVTFVARGEAARYVRFTALELSDANGPTTFALAEMQVWSGGRNAALGRLVSALDSMETEGWSRAALVDGFTSRANILDWPEWLAGLSQRRETMQRLATLDARQTAVLARFKTIGWWLLGCVVGGTLLVLLGFNLRQRRARRLEMEALRQRISQDLHDEIGSSLGSIALISEDALALAHDDAMRRELGEIRDTARQTLDSMRDLVRLAQSGKYGQGDLTEHLREIADRALRGIPHTLHDEAAAAFKRLPMNQRRDLVLMFKEAMHNLARHAQATQAGITLAQSNGALTLTVRDDGRGFDPAALNGTGMGLANLQRRAAKHGGSVRIVSAPAQGTTLIITLPQHA